MSAGQLSLDAGKDIISALEAYTRSYAVSDLEQLAQRVREEIRAELLSVGFERHAEYCVPEAPTPQ
jgi:hypothetical protein